jgi:hypothetical protein
VSIGKWGRQTLQTDRCSRWGCFGQQIEKILKHLQYAENSFVKQIILRAARENSVSECSQGRARRSSGEVKR